MSLLSGFGTRQTSFTPSSQLWVESRSSSNVERTTPARWPGVPSAMTVTCAWTSAPGSKADSSSPSRPRPLSPVTTPSTRPWSTISFWASVSGSMKAPSSSACSLIQRAIWLIEMIQLPWFFICGGVGIRILARLRMR